MRIRIVKVWWLLVLVPFLLASAGCCVNGCSETHLGCNAANHEPAANGCIDSGGPNSRWQLAGFWIGFGSGLLVIFELGRIYCMAFTATWKPRFKRSEESALVALIDQEALLAVTGNEVDQECADTSVKVRTKLKETAFRRHLGNDSN